uniref:protein ALTERED PHOSPHATE STARVATION RESPONSE 1-like n=1 Tax=Erigeron canadensis TaxID=72917 RepID=UPI001CB8A624|nr:protein ALTERED PHOSPHATE STARVATION RESPONSE 1-like [Erigeron canadensis]
MGCTMSFLKHAGGGEHPDDTLVSVCRERKKLMNSAVERRYILAGAHCKYNQSLYAVAIALRLFVSRHSINASDNFLLTYPAPSPYPTVDPHHTQSKPPPTLKADDDVEGNDNDDDEEESIVCEHFYDEGEVGPTTHTTVMTSANECDFMGWDFFSDNMVVVNNSEVGDVKKGKEVGYAKMSQGVKDNNNNSCRMEDEEEEKRGLLEALKQVEDCFLKAYNCGLDFSKLLEFNNLGPLDHLDTKETSQRLIPSIAWHKSSITRSPSCRSLLSSSSRSSSTWTAFNSNCDLFDETGGMESGSHLSTLGRLYAWEKKLCDEVKAGNEMKKLYDRKSLQLSKEKATHKLEIEDHVNDLYSRILVSMKICDSISKRIEKVRDDELQPQIIELLRGLTKTWKVMLELHKTQSRTMFEVKSFSCTSLTNNKSSHLATLQLEAEIQNWQTCFSNYISSMEAYVEDLTEWAYRTISPEQELNTPPLVFTVCRDWLAVTKNLPDKAVTYAMKRFAKDLRTLWAQQDIEQQQKRKVDKLVTELDKRVFCFEREEGSIVKWKSLNLKNKVDIWAEKKGQMDSFKAMVETEKAKHKECVEETRRVILVGFQTGFSSVFDSLTEFSEVCVRKYNDVAHNAISRLNYVHRF